MIFEIFIRCLTVLLVTTLFSCTGSAPSVSGFMNPKSEIFVKHTSKSGDLYNKYSEEYGKSYDELDEEYSTGLFLDKNYLKWGLEVGSSGLGELVLGIKNKYFGALGWLAVPIDNAVNVTYGAAIAEQYSLALLNSTFRMGIYEYINEFNVSVFDENDMLFRSVEGAKSYIESGVGIYSAVNLTKRLGISVDYKIGRQIKSHQIRRYLETMVFLLI